MPETYELHFRDGFAGETVEVRVDDEVVAGFEARTRMQVGLAHIERLTLSPGQVVEIRIGDDVSEPVSVEQGQTFINIDLKDNKIIIDSTAARPGYL